MYHLVDKVADLQVYGVFELQHSSSSIQVSRAMAWDRHSEPTPESVRGVWGSLRASTNGYQVEIVYDMKTLAADPETGFAGYQGILSLMAVARGRLSGHFADLGLRRGHYGASWRRGIPGETLRRRWGRRGSGTDRVHG